MSKILDSAKAFQAKSKEELASIEIAAKKDLEQFRISIYKELKQNEHLIKADIQDYRNRMRSLYSTPYKIGFGVLVTVIILMIGSLGYLGMKINEKQQTSLALTELIEEQDSKVKIKDCRTKNGEKPCVMVSGEYLKEDIKDRSGIYESNGKTYILIKE